MPLSYLIHSLVGDRWLRENLTRTYLLVTYQKGRGSSLSSTSHDAQGGERYPPNPS
jgi:hypothetical protein